jgi:hypothetical protein
VIVDCADGCFDVAETTIITNPTASPATTAIVTTLPVDITNFLRTPEVGTRRTAVAAAATNSQRSHRPVSESSDDPQPGHNGDGLR